MHHFSLCCLLLLVSIAMPGRAQDNEKLPRVLILGDKPVMTRPIPAAMVLDALPKACAVDPVLCRRVRRALKVYMQDSALEFASVEGTAVNGDSKMVMPNLYGQTVQSQWQVAGAILANDFIDHRLGIVTPAALLIAQRPHGHKRHVPGQVGIAAEDLFDGRAVEKVIVDDLRNLGTDVQIVREAVIDAAAGCAVPENSVAIAGDEKRDGNAGVVLRKVHRFATEFPKVFMAIFRRPAA